MDDSCSSSSMGNPTCDDNRTEDVSLTRPRANGHIVKPSRICNRVRKAKSLGKRLTFSDGIATSSSSSNLTRRVPHRKNTKVLLATTPRRKFCAYCTDVEALALPLGMSVAAFVAQMLDKNNRAWEKLPSDHLSMMCGSAVRESLTNVFGDKFEIFSNNFEKSFQSTLRTLSVINEYSLKDESIVSQIKVRSSQLEISTGHGDETMRNSSDDLVARSDITDHSCATEHRADEDSRGEDNNVVEIDYQREISQLILAPRSLAAVSDQLTTTEKCVFEQTRSNDLKTVEIGLTMRKLKLKEAQLALSYDSNYLERSKLAMGASKAIFQAEKFKTQLEDTRHNELLQKIIDCLVAGLFIMSTLLLYGAYVFSYKKISEATESCNFLYEESKSWWVPRQFTSFNSGWNILRCQVQVLSRMVFGMLMIIAVAYLFLQRSGGSQQSMPVTFILLLLGIACGFAGKLCVDTLGGSGLYWLLYWEILCMMNFLSVVFTPTLFRLLYGPVVASKETKGGKLLAPFWLRRLLYFALQLVVMPFCCGLLPFASLGEWTAKLVFSSSRLFSVAGLED